jgi:regulatory protein
LKDLNANRQKSHRILTTDTKLESLILKPYTFDSMYKDETIKIKRVQKRGRYHYLSCSNGEEYKVEPEIYYKYNLVGESVFDRNKFFAIVDENSFRLCLNSAIRLLSQRMHSVYEIKTKLKKKGFLNKIVNRSLDELGKMNLMNDEQFTKNYIDELIYRGQGRYKIINSLQKRGISKEMINENLQKLDDPDAEEKRAEEALKRKIKSLAYKEIEPRKLKEKVIRHLISKGFSSDIVFKITEKL